MFVLADAGTADCRARGTFTTRVIAPRDVFISHAYQDKNRYARPLVRALDERGVTCWIDEGQIGPGDSLIDAMNEGLRSSRYVVVLVTPRFLSGPWANKELNAALQLEARRKRTVVVPIVVDPEAVRKFPLLLDKLHLSWSDGLDHVADEIAGLFRRSPSRDWHWEPPEPYVGIVWLRVCAAPEHRGQPHWVTLRWGPYVRRHEIAPLGAEPCSLIFHKTNPDTVPLHAEVEPPAILRIGPGQAPDENRVIIDEGWVRSAGWNFPEESLGLNADDDGDVFPDARPG
ncbi:MAG TPA: toll/interleukin-1 receptor domain-containing protein [Solirubrobacteraceae bacterium]|nr:toll/interleukin-1 receptor domain-containing protein [Solirubrobacteraceae bacterium]